MILIVDHQIGQHIAGLCHGIDEPGRKAVGGNSDLHAGGATTSIQRDLACQFAPQVYRSLCRAARCKSCGSSGGRRSSVNQGCTYRSSSALIRREMAEGVTASSAKAASKLPWCRVAKKGRQMMWVS